MTSGASTAHSQPKTEPRKRTCNSRVRMARNQLAVAPGVGEGLRASERAPSVKEGLGSIALSESHAYPS